uniref:RNA polymerase sigma-70 region 2 domain-containing protein n=1 Tax=Corethron hystrix TaxID=216773 RepID=A0A7S1BN95_9STRA|mmetsp:Transcript_33230/g.76686  ORF Transcript_33230/g.76686 Transcript_33230/m.76686 type:complete len:475 (+) Transcript_33230:134-1558(+)
MMTGSSCEQEAYWMRPQHAALDHSDSNSDSNSEMVYECLNFYRRLHKRRVSVSFLASSCFMMILISNRSVAALTGNVVNNLKKSCWAHPPRFASSSFRVCSSLHAAPTGAESSNYWSRQKRRNDASRTSLLPSFTPLAAEEEEELLARAQASLQLQSVRRDVALSTLPRIPNDFEWASAAGISTVVDLRNVISEGERASERLMEAHIGLVRSVIKDEVGNGPYSGSLDFCDLVQEGSIGLSRAISKYDRTRTNGGRFATYATYWIRSSVLRSLAANESDDGIRIPEGIGRNIRTVLRIARRTNVDLKRASVMHIAQIADEAGVAKKVVKLAADVQGRKKGGKSLKVELQNRPAEAGAGAQLAARQGEREAMRDAIGRFLDSQELLALELRYGLRDPQTGDLQPKRETRDYVGEIEKKWFGRPENIVPRDEPMTFRDVGTAIGVSAEYGRRLCNRAVEKLKAAAQEGRLVMDFDI